MTPVLRPPTLRAPAPHTSGAGVLGRESHPYLTIPGNLDKVRGHRDTWGLSLRKERTW